MKNWKTSLAGFVFGLALMFGPRLEGQPNQPPITIASVIQGVAALAVGVLSKDHDKP